MNFRIYSFAVVLVGTMLVLSGCPPKKKLAIEDTQEKIEDVVDNEEDLMNQKDRANKIEINQEWSEIQALANVNFGYDAASLDDAAKAVLKTNVATIKKLPTSVSIRVEGHCDDRGTIEYNIALGQRRANVVRAYYERAGISKSRLETISYGEERPICTFETDGCWAQNRRSVTKVRNKEAISVNASDLK